MKFVHVQQFFFCNVEECKLASVMKKVIEKDEQQRRGLDPTAPQARTAASHGAEQQFGPNRASLNFANLSVAEDLCDHRNNRRNGKG